jgi:transglutaminase-like putative cysteine protease
VIFCASGIKKMIFTPVYFQRRFPAQSRFLLFCAAFNVIMKRALASVALAVFAGFAFAAEVGTIGFAAINARIAYDITVPAGVTQATFSAYAFRDTPAQSVVFSASDPYSATADDFGNLVLSFTYVPDGTNAKRITIDAKANVSYDPSTFNLEKAPLAGGPDYLPPSPLAKIDLTVSSLASSVAGRNSTALEKAVQLAYWVFENIEYDLAYKDFAADSVKTLESKRGTCDEKGHLLEALLRSQGIPARHVVGFAFSGDEWQPHAWAEALVGGGWVPFDPTYGEAMFLDASHLRLAVGRDQDDTRYDLRAIGLSNISSSTIRASYGFSFERQSNYSGFFSLSADFPKGDHPASAMAVVYANATNRLANRQIVVPLRLGLHEDFPPAGNAVKPLILGPGESGGASWSVVFPANLREGYSYNYSAGVGAYSTRINGALLARAGNAKAEQSVIVKSLSAKKESGGFLLKFDVANSGNAEIPAAKVAATAESFSGSKNIGSIPVGKSTQVEFLMPYGGIGPAAGGGFVSGKITVAYGNRTFEQAFSIDLSEPSPTALREGGGNGAPPDPGPPPLLLGGALVAIVLILLIAKLFRGAQ